MTYKLYWVNADGTDDEREYDNLKEALVAFRRVVGYEDTEHVNLNDGAVTIAEMNVRDDTLQNL